jgi:hypothetical protein
MSDTEVAKAAEIAVGALTGPWVARAAAGAGQIFDWFISAR